MPRVAMPADQVAELYRQAGSQAGGGVAPVLTTVFARIVEPVVSRESGGAAHAAFMLEDGSYLAIRARRCCGTWHGAVAVERGGSLKAVLATLGIPMPAEP